MLVHAQRVVEGVSPAARITLSTDGSRVLVIAPDVSVFDASDGAKREVVLRGRKDSIQCVDATPRYVAVGRGKSVHLLDVASEGHAHVLETNRRFLVDSVAFVGGLLWTAANWAGRIRAWDPETATPRYELSVFELVREPERSIQGFVVESARGRLTCLLRTRASGSAPTYALHRVRLDTGTTEWTGDVTAQSHAGTHWFADAAGALCAWGEGCVHRLEADGSVVTEPLPPARVEAPSFDWSGAPTLAVPAEEREGTHAVWCPLRTTLARVQRRAFYRREVLHTEFAIETAAGGVRVAGPGAADAIGAREVGSRVEVFVRHPAAPKRERLAVTRFDLEPTRSA